MALIKISTENITAQERRRITFKGNLATYFDVHLEPSEIYLYISARVATFIEIHHPDYGKTEFILPFDLDDFCGYEMVLQYVPLVANANVTQRNNYLTITSDQPNASIYIDDDYVSDGFKSLEIGITPYQSDKMASGTYNIRVVKDMYKTAEQTFNITDGNTTDAVINMAANFVTLTIETDANSDIYIDEQYKAKGKWSGRISDGAHFVEVKKHKHKTVSKNINLVLGKDENIKIEAPIPITGFLDVSSVPVKADIYLNGKHYGTTPRIISDLIVGDYTLKLEKQGCASVIKNITIEENQTLSVRENLPTGKEVVIKTDTSGDKVYIDGNYVGTTPLTTNLSYGSHNLKALRDSQIAVKTVEVKTTTVKDEFVLAFGKMINITSNKKGDDIYVDGKKVGTTPMEIDFSLGKHEVEVRRGKLYETRTLTIDKNSSTLYSFVPKKEPLNKYLDRGITFVTLNGAYSSAPQTAFGLTFGRVKKMGWFVSAMSNFNFAGFNTIDDNYEEVILTGNTASTRLSVMGGFITRIAGPVYFKVGAGYGMIVRCCETIGGDYVEYKPNTFKGVDLGAGLQFNLRNITFDIDAVTTNFKMTEVRLGIGVNFN